MRADLAPGFATPSGTTASGTGCDNHFRIIGRMIRNVHPSTQPKRHK